MRAALPLVFTFALCLLPLAFRARGLPFYFCLLREASGLAARLAAVPFFVRAGGAAPDGREAATTVLVDVCVAAGQDLEGPLDLVHVVELARLGLPSVLVPFGVDEVADAYAVNVVCERLDGVADFVEVAAKIGRAHV